MRQVYNLISVEPIRPNITLRELGDRLLNLFLHDSIVHLEKGDDFGRPVRPFSMSDAHSLQSEDLLSEEADPTAELTVAEHQPQCGSSRPRLKSLPRERDARNPQHSQFERTTGRDCHRWS